jgi:hypothetical protein
MNEYEPTEYMELYENESEDEREHEPEDDVEDEEAAFKGVRAGVLDTQRARYMLRMPTPLAPARGVQRLRKRSGRLEIQVARQGQYLRDIARTGRRQTFYSGWAAWAQQVREVAAEARPAVAAAAAANPLLEPIAASVDYTLSLAQTAVTVAAVAPEHRSWGLALMPIANGMAVAPLRELARLPFGIAGKAWWTLALPAVGGIAATVALRPRRRRQPRAW